ncbi:MAG: encapsulin [Methylococcales bacterium]
MNTNDYWTTEVWTKFNGIAGDKTQPGLLKTIMAPMRIAQHIFPTIVQGNNDSIPADTVNLDTGIPSSGSTKALTTILKSFSLLQLHIDDPKLTMAMNQVMLAAQSLALVEDAIYFQGKNANLPQGVSLQEDDKLEDGLLGIAKKNKTIQVRPSNEKEGIGIYGSATYAAVVEGLAFFSANAQGMPFALILEPNMYADANVPLEDSPIITPASAIQALVEPGGFVMSPGLPPKTGLLVALGGQSTTLYVGTEPVIEPNTYAKGIYTLDARESIQFHNIDPRSLIKLEFLDKKNERSNTTSEKK